MPVTSNSSEPVDNRPPTQEIKQTSHEAAISSERSRSNQAPVKNVDFMEGPSSRILKVVPLSIGLASPWYNRTGWLDVKHQFTYLPLDLLKILQ